MAIDMIYISEPMYRIQEGYRLRCRRGK